MTITEFLAARLDEDEAAARKAASADHRFGGRAHWSALGHGIVTDAADPDWGVADLGPCIDDDALAEHIVRHDPARVLRAAAASRVILAEHEAVLGECHTMELKADRRPRKYGEYDGLHKAVVELAAVYSDHPDYDRDWAVG